MSENIEFMSAVLLVSANAPRLAAFYREVIGIPLETEKHGNTAEHYGCELGDLHFAIHPAENFKDRPECGVGSVRLAFSTFDMGAFVERVRGHGIALAYPPRDVGFAIMTALTDPDGNYVEFTQLSDRWLKHLEKRKEQGVDIVKRWKSRPSRP